MGSANTVVDTLNSVGTLTMWAGAVIMSLLAIVAAWALVTGTKVTVPTQKPGEEPQTLGRGTLAVGLLLLLVAIAFQVATITSDTPLAKTYRTMRGGSAMSDLFG